MELRSGLFWGYSSGERKLSFALLQLDCVERKMHQWTVLLKNKIVITTTPPQPFYSPFFGTTRVSQCQNRTSGLYGARED